MNNKVFGTINSATWATGDEIGRQFDVLNSISKGSSVIDVCDLCKNGNIQMSPDSIINVEEGCRCKAKEAPNLTTGGGVVDVADMANNGLRSQQLHEEIVNEEINDVNSNYVSEQPPEPTNEQPTNEQQINEQPAENEIQVVGVDDGAVEKFCSGHMSPIEYSINIVIIILFISISVMAIIIIFKLAMKCCSCNCCIKCGKGCKETCSKCKKCMNCCKCSSINSSLMGGYNVSYSKPSTKLPNNSYSKPSTKSFVNPSRLTGDIF